MALDLWEETQSLLRDLAQKRIEYALAGGREQDLADIRRLQELDR